MKFDPLDIMEVFNDLPPHDLPDHEIDLIVERINTMLVNAYSAGYSDGMDEGRRERQEFWHSGVA